MDIKLFAPMSIPTACVIRQSPRGFNRNPLSPRAFQRGRGAGFHVKAATADGDGFAELAKWVQSYDGLVYQALTVGYSPQTGDRGVISQWDLSTDDILDVPLMLIPEELYMSEASATRILNPLLESKGLPSITILSGELQVALLLAYEKTKGEKSMWFPYIEMLPQDPPSGFLWPPQKVEQYFSTLPINKGKMMDMYRYAQPRHLRACNAKIDTALDEFGDELGVSKDDLLWSVCQVSSRAFLEDDGAGVRLKPVIDLINHSHKALPPRVVGGENPVTFVETEDPIPEGGELFIDYIFDPRSMPLKEFMQFGFIPEELLGAPSLQ